MFNMNISDRLSGYSILEQLYSGFHSLVYRGIRDCDRLQVIIKVLSNPFPHFNELVQFRNQYVTAKNLDHPNIVKPLALEPYQNGYALMMEDIGGISLRQYLQVESLSLEETLAIAVQMAEVLHYLSQHRVVHKDINPANILIEPKSKQIKLIDFSLASLLPKEFSEIQTLNLLEGAPAYIAPEQTGRMNRGIDYRTDFYGLGVTLYELLTGELPFPSDNLLELMYCHIAKPPVSPHQLNSTIPPVISAIVLKLMAKNAEDRYQSALALKYDLEKCLSQKQETGKMVEFEVGQRDLSDRFLISEKLYGREEEVQTLLDAFERVANPPESPLGKGGHRGIELMLVAGFSGIGKTAVVNEVHKPIVKQKGYFIKGKFDQFNRNIPFSGLVQALRDLMRQLMSESDAQLQSWKSKIMAALGENGQVIINVIPELEQIIGVQPTVLELSDTAAQNRFNLLFQKFIEVFTTPEHPLVMFLDDLQWVDSASLNLINLLMTDSEIGYLLLMGAYRDNEVSPAHPLILALDGLVKTGATVNTLTLYPLSQISLNHLVADTLHCTEPLAQPLTELIYQKTQGNPFFATQFLKALHQDGLIEFDWQMGHWQCDLVRVRDSALTDDVVEFMAWQLQKLSASTQGILKLAACIGNQFDLETLAIVSEQSETETATILWPALQQGLILPQSQIYKFYVDREKQESESDMQVVNYRFLHDRVQQAAYSLIPKAQKESTHYHIGQLLLQKIPPATQEDRIFELVSQLNYGTALITEQKERDDLAQLNLIACRKARAVTAYKAGREYASTGLSLLGEKPWQRQYEMSLAFHDLAAELASLCGNFEVMEQFIETVIAQAQALLDQLNVYRVRILANFSQNKLREAIVIAQQFLQQLGITLTETPTQKDIQESIGEIKELIKDKEIEDLVDLPIMMDGEKIAIIQIANSIIPIAYMSGSPLFPLLVSLSVKLSIQSGNTSISAFAYACYGIITCNLLQDVDAGVKFGLLALQVIAKLDAKASKPEVLSVVGFFILHRKSHLKETLLLLQQGYPIALEVGNHEMAGYIAHELCIHSFWCSQSLVTLEQESRAYCKALIHLNQLTIVNWCRISWQVNLNLLGFEKHPDILSGEALQESEFLAQLKSANDRFGLYFFHLHKLMLCYLFGKIESAQNHAIEIGHYLMAGTGTIGEPVFYFYDSLTSLATLNSSSSEASELFSQVEQNQTKLQEYWADYAPMNHQHKVDLVEAEKCRVLGQKAEAIELYDQAISGAKENGYIQEEALANELAAKFYLDWGKEKVAAGYMQDAYYSYSLWGAKAKTDHLEKLYPNLLQPILQQPEQNRNLIETLVNTATVNSSIDPSAKTTPSSSTSINSTIDLAAVLKACQVLSRIIQLDELLHQLTQIILQNSGGDRCALILISPDQVAQVCSIATPEKIDLCSEPLENYPNLPVKLIQYVKNTQDVVLIDDLQTDLPIIDEYLNSQQPKSILCLPLLNQGNLKGIIYLSNQSTRGVFRENTILILNVLCTQAVIALENADLYRLEQKKREQLNVSESRFRTLFENATDAIMLYGKQRRFIDCNQSTLDLFGCSSKADFCFFHPAQISPEFQPDGQRSLDKANAMLKEAFDKGSHRFEWVHQRLDGENFWTDIVLTAIPYEGETIIHALVRDISDRKQVETELKESETRFRRAIAGAPFPIMIHAEDGEVLQINDTWRELTGYTHDDIPTIANWAQRAYGEKSGTVLKEVIAKKYSLKSRWDEGEFLITTSDGNEIIWQFSSAPLGLLKDGRRAVISMAVDVTQRKQAEIAVQQKVRREQVLNQVVQAIRSSLDLETIFSTATQALAHLFEISKVAIAQYQPEQSQWIYINEYRYDTTLPNTLGFEIPDENNPFAEKLKRFEIVQVNDTRTIEDPINREIAKILPGAWSLFPLEVNQNLWGVLVFLQRQPTASYSEEDLRLVQQITEQLAIAIQQAELYQQVQQEKEKLIKSETALIQAEEIAQLGNWELDATTQKMIWSENLFRMFGFDPAAPEPDFADVMMNHVHPEDLPRLEQAIDQVMTEGISYEIDLRILRADGSIGYMEARAEAIRDQNGQITKLFGTCLDISDRKEVEAQILEMNQRLTLATTSAKIGIWDLDVIEDKLFWDNRTYEIYGCSPESYDSVRQTWQQHAHPEDRLRVNAQVQAAIDGEQEFHTEFRAVWPDGQVRFIEAQAIVLRDVEGIAQRMIGVNIDITERKQAEAERLQAEKLRLELKLMEQIFDIILAGYWDWDIPNHHEYMSPGFKRMFGYEDHELANTPETWQNLIFPEDLPKVLECFDHHVRSRGKIPYYNEVRYGHKDGSTVWVICSGQVIEWDEAGNPLRMIGCHIDISDRKQAEIALQQKTEELDRFFSLALDLLSIANTEGHFLRLNSEWENTLGYPLSELEGANFFDYVHQEDLPSTLKAIAQLKAGEKILNFINRYRCRDGSYRWLEWRAVPIDNLIYSAARDITDRQYNEEQIRRYTAQLETSNQELEAFAYSVSHDLRSPLRAIDGFSKALLEDYGETFDEEAKYYFDRIRKNVSRMGTLIDDLLRLSRVSRSQMRYTTVNLSTLAQELVNDLQASEPERQVEVAIAPEVLVCADATLMRMLLTNLLENAWKFTSRHSSAKIEFGIIHQNKETIYFVQDNGAGFDMSYAKMLFGVFQRLHSTDEFPGTGIGLATVQRAIHRHGGRIWAEAAVEKGATFYFTLPNTNFNVGG